MILECYDFLFSQPAHYIFSIDKMILECYDFLWDGMQENIKKINKKRHPEIKSGKCLNACTDSEIKSLESTSSEERMAQCVAVQEVNVDDVLPPAGNENAAPAVDDNATPAVDENAINAVNKNATPAVNENATSDDEETPGAYSDKDNLQLQLILKKLKLGHMKKNLQLQQVIMKKLQMKNLMKNMQEQYVTIKKLQMKKNIQLQMITKKL